MKIRSDSVRDSLRLQQSAGPMGDELGAVGYALGQFKPAGYDGVVRRIGRIEPNLPVKRVARVLSRGQRKVNHRLLFGGGFRWFRAGLHRPSRRLHGAA